MFVLQGMLKVSREYIAKNINYHKIYTTNHANKKSCHNLAFGNFEILKRVSILTSTKTKIKKLGDGRLPITFC